MKRLLSGLLVLAVSALSMAMAFEGPVSMAIAAPAHAHGVHGMLVFGEPGQIFASHLPLYRHPHDWQVVLELTPATTDGQKITDELLAKGGLLTLEPERFDLFRLKPDTPEPLREFKGKLYRDHFERGGEAVAELVWQVKRTWLFEPVRVNPQAEPGERYFRIGNGGTGKLKTFWLLHKVEQRPDIDQVLAVHYAGEGLPALFTTHDLLGSDNQASDNLANDNKDSPFKATKVLWQDSDDLQ